MSWRFHLSLSLAVDASLLQRTSSLSRTELNSVLLWRMSETLSFVIGVDMLAVGLRVSGKEGGREKGGQRKTEGKWRRRPRGLRGSNARFYRRPLQRT